MTQPPTPAPQSSLTVEQLTAIYKQHGHTIDALIAIADAAVAAERAHSNALIEAAKQARLQLKLWMRDHGQDFASQAVIRAIDAAIAAQQKGESCSIS